MESADGSLSDKEESSPDTCETSAGELGFRSGKKRNLIAGLGFLVAILLLFIMGWIGSRTVAERREANNRVVHTYQVIDKLHEVFTDLLDAETSQRNFIITGDQRHLKRYHAAVSETEKGIATLKGLVATVAVQHKLVEIEAAARERLARLEAGIEIRKAEGFQAGVAHIQSGRGREIMDRARSRVAEAVDLERALLEKRSAEQASTLKRLDQARVAGAFLVVGILAAVFTALMREITRRGRMESELQCRQKQLYAVLEERTRANEALRQSEQRFSSFMSHLSAAAWVKDRMGRYVYGNAEHERIFSMPLSEYSGLRDDEVLPEEIARPLQENDERVLADGESLQAIEALRQGDGVEHQFLVTKFPIPGADSGAEYVAGIAIDITESVAAEKALRFSEARFRVLHDDNPAMIFTLDAEGNVLSSNPACRAHLGYTEDELAGQPVLKIFHEDERPVMAEHLQTCLRNPDRVYHWQSRKIDKNGDLVWVEELARVTYDMNGAPNVLVVCQDVTERKRAEEALQKSESKLAKIFHAVPAQLGISTLKEGRFVEVNETTLQVLGYRRDEMIGRTVSELNLWEDMSDRTEILRMLEEKGSVKSIEVRLRGKSGQTLVGLFSAEYIDIDDERYMLSLIRDITERKRAEEALQKSERKLARIFHSAPALISISTLDDGRVIDINETALQTLGYQRDEVIGRTTYEINFWVNESDRVRAIQILEEQGSVRNFEFEFRGKTGQIFTGLLSGERIDIECEQCLLALVKDITLKKQAQAQVERLNADLTARAAELEEVNRDLEAFNYTIAHDLRKPLSAINGYCQLIREFCGDTLDEQCAMYLQEAYDGTWRMNRLIDTLLNFSRANRVELRLEKTDLSETAQAVATELTHAEPSRRATFRIAEGISAVGDAGLLRVVLANLIGNAWKYTAIREEALLEFGEVETDGERAFFVRDNGHGFAMADADQLFVPFRRLPGAEKQTGFGIGLATVERIIRRHGGRVWAEGEPGKGATFWFTLGMGKESPRDKENMVVMKDSKPDGTENL